VTMLRTHTLLPVLEHRQSRTRSALARASAACNEQQNTLAALDKMIHAIDARVRTLHDALGATATHTAASLQDVQQNVGVLTTARSRLLVTRRATQQSLQLLAAQRHEAMQRWRLSQLRLEHARTLARRADLLVALRAEDALQTEHYSLAVANRAMTTK
jgi:tRNA G37 N-methylase TrmD